MRLNKNDFSIDQRPALKVEQLEGKTAAVLTISGVRSGNIPDRNAPGGARFTVRVSVEEFPDYQFYVNPAGVTALIEKYGEEDTAWIGQALPLIVKQTTNPITSRQQLALHVAPLNEFDGLVDGTGAMDTAETPHSLTARKSAAKKPARRK